CTRPIVPAFKPARSADIVVPSLARPVDSDVIDCAVPVDKLARAVSVPARPVEREAADWAAEVDSEMNPSAMPDDKLAMP
ncbi:hypothetical protein, partial [Burkholderia gladioli]|uniref:hypothetical protein n=1 Tax=Burkholderia gladioli TaxID=28095 RepID=UPI00164215C1